MESKAPCSSSQKHQVRSLEFLVSFSIRRIVASLKKGSSVSAFKNNKPDGAFIKIFTNWGDFFYGSFRNGNINKGSFGGGWKIEHEGFNIAYLQWSKSENSFRRLKSKSNFIPQISKYIQSYEYHFNKYKWFPNKICKNETDFIKTLKNWKKNSKKIAETALDTYNNHEMHLGEYEHE